MDFTQILTATIWVFLVVGVGGVTRLTGIVNEQSEQSLLRMLVNVLYPCFIMARIPGNETLQNPFNVVLAIGVGFSMTLLSLAIAYGVGIGLRIEAGKARNTFCVASAIQNYGFIPIPLIEALFPETKTQILGVLFVHNLGLELAMWSVGIVVLSGRSTGMAKRLINGPTIAILLGLLVNGTGAHQIIPSYFSQAIHQIGGCSIPIGLMLVGATLAGVLQRERWTMQWNVISGSCALRFLLMPIVFLGVARLVAFSPELMRVMAVQSAMPAAIFPIVLAKHFGGKPNIAVQVSLATSVVCVVLMPLILMSGMTVLGIVD